MTHVPTTPHEHLTEERLVDLALGEAASTGESQHLRACTDCGPLLDSLHRTMDVTRESSGIDLITPPDEVWSRIADTIAADEVDAADRPRAVTDPNVVPLTSATGARSRRGRRPAVVWLAAACAAGVLLGAVGSVVAERLGSSGSEAERTVATAKLATLDTEEQRGSATVHERGGRLVLEVTAPGVEVTDGYAEVWLINSDGERMVSVGVLEDSRSTASFPISRSLLDNGYVVVDISREDFDDQPQHSGDSFVRGPLTQES
ncbi:anti-sigma factor [Janibacter cremeus]|uniref:anti-sigma factor n=1 Tax=Janibacter cremeus TaxID=1285192 RepID=UPI0023F9B344|nr:anti-sigma factor [Janibacter cremeus]WEV77138.1 anti-sigma factor [Janibacter cremeus]